jgi:hypothetical protein
MIKTWLFKNFLERIITMSSNLTTYNKYITSEVFTFKLNIVKISVIMLMEQRFKNVNICLNTNIDSYQQTSGGQRYNLYLNVVHFFNASVN